MKRLAEVAALLSVSLAIFLVTSEIGLRFYLERNPSFDVEMGRYARLLEAPSPNPEIRHRQKPGADLQLMGVHVATNAEGFRDADMESEKLLGVRRIVLLGDSLTFGWGVELEDTFASLLEARLDAERPTEVLNLGHVNYNTVQQVALFLEAGLAYDPDQVVVFFFINDAEPVPPPTELSWLGNLRVRTVVGSRLRALRARFDEGRDFRGHYSSFYASDAPGWLAAQDAFRRLRDACAERRIALQVVLLPELHVLEDYPFSGEHGRVVRVLEDLGVPALDLAPRFATEREPQALWVAPDDAHPNARGHAKIAREVFDFVARP